MASSLIRVYCCWDVGNIHKNPKFTFGETAGKSSFVEDGATVNTFAHELGHALGLDHNTRGATRLMFDNFSPARTFKLDQFEIDTINRSGT